MKIFTSFIVILFTANLFVTNAQTVSTFAGNTIAGYSGDGGPATLAELTTPTGISLDNSGNMYIADWNNVVRYIDKTTGIISTIAGNGFGGYSGDGGPATSAELWYPTWIIFDRTGNILISDQENSVVRKIDKISGIISTIAGNGSYGFSGDGGPATSAELYSPIGLAFDKHGNLFIADGADMVVRKIDSATGNISTVIGNFAFGAGYSGDGGPDTSAQLNEPTLISFDRSGNLYIADSKNNAIRKVDTSGIITTAAGNGSYGFSGDGGPATSAELNNPTGIIFDPAGNMIIADDENYVVRKVNKVSGTINTIAGNNILGPGYGGDGGPATSAQFDTIASTTLDSSGDLYVADWKGNVIRKITGINLGTSTVSGSNSRVYAFPNPSSGIFTLQLSVISSQLSVEVYNVFGQLIYSQYSIPNTQYKFDLSNQPDGVYFYRVENESGIKMGEGKMVIEQ